MEALQIAHREGHRPWIATATVVALLVVLQRDDVGGLWRHAAGIAVVVGVCWMIAAGLRIGEELVVGRLRVTETDDVRLRRARTQVLLLRRIGVAVVVVIGAATVLMSFSDLRAFGASLLASAGLAGVIAGLAAQTTLSNVFAGLQLAFTNALRVDDVVVVEGEWGGIEDITLTNVVLRIWDERRLVLPTTYFVTTPFENWTRTYSRVLGAVVLHLDYRTPLPALRERARTVIEASPLWDRRDWGVQVIDTTESTLVVRVLASAFDAPSAWDLRCDIREDLVRWLLENHPEALPVHRAVVAGRDGDDDSPARDGLVDAADVGALVR